MNFFGHIQYSSRKAGRKMVRKIAEEKTMVRIYGLFKREEWGRKGKRGEDFAKILSSFIERHSKCPHRRWGKKV